MRRALPLAAALFLAFAAYSFQAVQLPGRAVACSCAGPPSLQELGRSKTVVLVIGKIGPRGPITTPVTVEGWFLGPQDLGSTIRVASGESFGSSCDVYLATGERWLMTLYLDQVPPAPSTCSLNGLLGTPSGDSLLAEAMALFGPPTRPPPTSASPSAGPSVPPPTPTVAPSPDSTPTPANNSAPGPTTVVSPPPWRADGAFWAAAAFAVGVLILGAVVLIAKRRPAR